MTFCWTPRYLLVELHVHKSHWTIPVADDFVWPITALAGSRRSKGYGSSGHGALTGDFLPFRFDWFTSFRRPSEHKMAIAHKKYIPNTHHFTQCWLFTQGSSKRSELKATHGGRQRRDCGTPPKDWFFPDGLLGKSFFFFGTLSVEYFPSFYFSSTENSRLQHTLFQH